MRAPADDSGASIYKLMADRPRLPKPWEADYEESQAFIKWADAIPESTPRALLPIIWPLRDRLAFQDGGGLNGFLKERGLTKAAWKVVNGFSLTEAAMAYNHYRGRGDSTWPVRLVAPAVSVREVDVNASLPLLFTMAEAGISVVGVAKPYQQDWRLMLNALSAHVEGLALAECAPAIADAILVRDYFEAGDIDVSPSTTWAEMKALADAWIAQVQAEDMQMDGAAPANGTPTATPGGEDVFADTVTEMTVHRLTEFPHFAAESDLMGHCIGRSQNYFNKHVNGTGAFYSFRVPGRPNPVATLELGLTEGSWRVCQVRGPANRDPGPDAHALAERLREAHQMGGMLRESGYELICEVSGRAMPGLENTSSRYF